MCFGQKLKKQQQQNNTSPLPEPELNPGRLAPKPDALALHH